MTRIAPYLPLLAVAGALVCLGQVLYWFSLGAWPPHDTGAYYLAGLHLREGAPVYGAPTVYLAFMYAPPWAVISAGASFLPFELVSGLLLGGQVAALRYVMGSWRNVGLVCWLPFLPREFVTGNVNLLMAAAILAGIRGIGWPAAIFAFAKVSPVLLLARPSKRLLVQFIVASAGCVALTLPWLHLWPEWLNAVATGTQASWLPIAPRVPVVLVLLALRKPWSIAAACALATPAFYFHSLVLLLPAVRLYFGSAGPSVTENGAPAVTLTSRVAMVPSALRVTVTVASPAD